jgi:hypothetical protein
MMNKNALIPPSPFSPQVWGKKGEKYVKLDAVGGKAANSIQFYDH